MRFQAFWLALLVGAAITGCTGGAETVPATPAATNSAPAISGSPATQVTTGSAYNFLPSAVDRDGQALTFAIANRPAWATFNTSTGLLSGTPGTAAVGAYSGIVISVSDGESSSALSAFTITVVAAHNGTPSIFGAPATRVVAGTAYAFTPVASDPDGATLAFSIARKPDWAVFNVSTGALTGTPSAAQAGTYSNIVITVSDGVSSVSLPAFAITVDPPPSVGTAALSWSTPTQNTDGTPLTNLAGFRVYHGSNAGALTDVRSVSLPATTYEFTGLASGTHYFAVTALNAAGVESALSAIGSKSIP